MSKASFLVMSTVASLLAGGLRADQTFRSGPGQVALIELYTSEGCSSCPPAEAWLGERQNDRGLWREFVPVAFHVNYWDRLGWPDALASKAFTDREYAYAAAWKSASVYTPCFVRNGAEWRPSESALRPAGGPRDAGTLMLKWDPASRTCRVEFQPPSSLPSAAAYEASVALLGGGIVSNVRKGENAGRKLRHEFVALHLESVPLIRQATGSWTAAATLPARTDVTTARAALAGWVLPRGQPMPVQAVGGWIEKE